MVRVRPAKPDDAAAVARIYVETWRSVYAGVVPDRVLTQMSQVRQSLAWRREIGMRGGRRILVAELGDAGVVGFVGVGPSRCGPLPFDGEIHTLYISDDFQGRGIGRALLEAGLGTLKEKGFAAAVVWVLSANPARYFYEAMGGRRVAERNEPLWGTVLRETAYGWPDLVRRLEDGVNGARDS
ncbi:MAG: GNAT family N-acetyltransferase [Rhodospirillales bacterium]|nr:GNAT family N-acetyltransferase [Rhodospirillales bacterium]